MMLVNTIPFYQSEWNGINLIDIARETGSPLGQPASAEFYASFYKKLKHRKFQFAPDWLEKKKNQSHWLQEKLIPYIRPKSKILSIGAGLGIIEMPLIQQGLNIDLQDCQKDSFDFLDNLHKTKINLYACKLGAISTQSYNICFSLATTYTMTENHLKNFIDNIYRILKPGGVFIWMDTSLSWQEIYSYIRNFRALPKNNILWGYKRSIKVWKNIACHSNLSTLSACYYDASMNVLNPNKLLGIPLNLTPTWQELTLKK